MDGWGARALSEMVEISLMDPSKETDNKLRWRADVEGVDFKLYIPKWRVPLPWPRRIIVVISALPMETSRATQAEPPNRGAKEPRERAIVAVVDRVREHTETVRFAPRGDPEQWEIGEPYIPYALLPTPSTQSLRLEVRWDRTAGTWSDE